ncbi:MAG: lysophospholipid acyltransferase family protein [Ktedonobacteraceae bacterium]
MWVKNKKVLRSIMIPAHKFPLGQRLVWQLIERSLRKYFDRVYFRIRGEYTDEQRATLSILIYANHSSWWDGYVVALVDRLLGTDGYLMVEEAQLRRYFFFTWLGCFSVDRHNTRSALQSLKYAATLLKEQPARMVSLFPQGEIFPNDRRPLVFYNGATYLARMAAPVLFCPLAIRIEYLAEQRPALFISLGEPVLISAEETQESGFMKTYTKHLEATLTAELDLLRTDVLSSDYTSFKTVLEGKKSTNRIFDTLFFRKQIDRQ